MKTRLLHLVVASVALVAPFAAPALAAPGDVDPSFNPNVNGTLWAAAVQPDGKIVLAGAFSSVAGTARNYLARLHADGSLDSAFNPEISGAVVYAIAVQPDGKIVIGGSFTGVAGTTRNHLARLHADGSLDTGFNPNLNSFVSCLAVQTDGKILLGGDFISVSGIARTRIARLQADGTLDTAFNPSANNTVLTMAVQTDGKVLLGGDFNSVSGIARNRIARLQAAGTLDTAFNPNANGGVETVVVQPDGKVLLGGFFSTVAGGTRNRIARLEASGALDSGFNPNANDGVHALALQADGKVIVGGFFSSIGGTARYSVARLNANGTLESTFNPNSAGSVTNVAIQTDGQVLVGKGFFSLVSLARLRNDPATGSLTVSSASRVQWLRGGASPEVEQVTFELSTDGGNTYSALGAGTRIAGGWEKTGLSLPANGEVRARGRTLSGYRNGSWGLVETLAVFGSAAPEIAVEQPPGTDLADGGSASFGSVGVGDSPGSLTFTIKNTGTATLTGLAITKDGPDQGMFTVTARPSAPVPGGGSTTFTVQFAPTGTGAKSATLHIANNDSNENPFDLTLTGTGALSTNADLAALSMSAGAFAPPFASATTSYAASVASQTSSITVTPTTSGAAATVTVNGVAVASGSASAPISLSVGATVITVVATAGDGVSTKTYTLTLTRPAPGSGPGDVESGFDPDVRLNSSSGNVRATAVQPDGKVVIGGFFDSVAGIARNHLARINVDGTLDGTFAPNPNGQVDSAVVQGDGKVVIGGIFTTVAGIARNYIARLNADGTLDFAFNPNANSRVGSVAVQADGKILLGGSFTSVGGVARNFIARLNANGTLDGAFNPNADGSVNTLAVQADGKIVIGGSFISVGAVPRNYIARLNANGTLDTGFNPNASNGVYAVGVQPDGKILLAGDFSTVGGIARDRVARFNPDGTLDGGFQNPGVNTRVHSLALQTDGKVLVGGEFSSIGGVPRARIARLHADGTLDSAFDPNPNSFLYSVAVQADGQVLLGGEFTTVGGTARYGVARLMNDAVTESLALPSPNRVEWLRAGAAPEVEQVIFELSTDGITYNALGAGARIAGGWERTGLSLPAGGEIRARGRTTGGYGSGSSGLVEAFAAFGTAAPDIAVEQPPGTNIPDGGSKSFGAVIVGDGAASLTFTIRNIGTATLTGLTMTKDGVDAAMFTVTANPAPPVPVGGSTSFTVRFEPTGAGLRTAALHIASNDSDENPFDLMLTATGTLSANADLAALSVSGVTLNPAFASGTTSYSASVASAVGKVRVTPSAAQSTATITVNGVAVASGTDSAPISLGVGANTLTTVVTAGDGVTTRTYTVAITRAVPMPGDVDGDFNPDPNSEVYTTTVQPDGKILIGGFFSAVGGLARDRLARLFADGTVESTATFNSPGFYFLSSLAVQADGKILVAGDLLYPLARLNPDGTVESAATFNPGTGPNSDVIGMALQADGRILLVGFFTAVNGQSRNRIARLLANGTVEDTATFDPGTGADALVYSVAVQADGKILLGGSFTTFNGQPRNRMARLNTDGSLESTATFNPGLGADSDVYSVAVQPNGKILLGGAFTSVNGLSRNRIARLHADGTVESTATFNPGTGADGDVNTVALQADGKILLGGEFSSVDGQPRGGIARLHPDGSLESTATFNLGTGVDFGTVHSLALQADGAILLGGYFFGVNDQDRRNVARLINDAAFQSFTLADSTRVQWSRSGAAPEVEQVTFELSTDAGQNWSLLGPGTRIAGGWERTGLSLPESGSIRARGRTVGGQYNGSSGLVEQVATFSTPTPLQEWKLLHLGNANAPDLGDPDHDGLLTLAEYGLNLLPQAFDSQPGVTRFAYPEGERLRIFVERDPAHDDVTVEVQASGSPAGPWTSLATSVLGAPFSGPGYVSGDSATPGVKTVEVRDTVNIGDEPSRFLRVKVSH